MQNAWTGGQYSLFRSAFGLCMCLHFGMLATGGAKIPSDEGILFGGLFSPVFAIFPNLFALSDEPQFVTGVLVVCALLAIFFTVGYKDRWAAIALCYVWACLFERNPMASNPGLPYVGLLLLVHAILPRAPFGSWEARGRTDPDAGWKLAPGFFGVVWLLMALGYSYSGFSKLMNPVWRDGTALEQFLTNPPVRPGGLASIMAELPGFLLQTVTWGVLALELGFVFFALFKRLRPWAWTLMFAAQLGLLLLSDFAELSLGMVMLHLFTFNPQWIRARTADTAETVFYDGTCGLCHRTVRMILAEDRRAAFRFAPLDSNSFAQVMSAQGREQLPDSLVVHRADGVLLMRSDGAAHILIGLGGAWGLLGRLLRIIPRPLRDAGYDLVAANRKRVFARPLDPCPLLPPHLQNRFLL